MFEEQMRALEQQQAQELLSIPVDSNGNGLQHMAASAPTTPPRVNALLPGGPEISPTIRTNFTRVGLDTDVLSRAVGSVADKRKSVTYAPATRSPELPPNNPHGNNGSSQGYGRAGAKSMPASRRTSASSHDEEIVGRLQVLSMAGETLPPVASKDQISLQKNGAAHEDGLRYGTYNAGMMLDEQLDEEMNSEYHYQSGWLVHIMYFQMLSSSYLHPTMTSFKFLIFRRCVLLVSCIYYRDNPPPFSCLLRPPLWTWLRYLKLLHAAVSSLVRVTCRSRLSGRSFQSLPVRIRLYEMAVAFLPIPF